MRMRKALAMAVGGALLLLPPTAQGEVFSGARSSLEENLPSALLPFSLGEVLRHFNEAFASSPSGSMSGLLFTQTARILTKR